MAAAASASFLAFSASAEALRALVREEKIAHVPAGVRDDVRRAFLTPEEKRGTLEKYLTEKFKAEVGVSRAELESRFKDFKDSSDEIQKKLVADKNRLRPEPRIRALFDMGGEPYSTRILAKCSSLRVATR